MHHSLEQAYAETDRLVIQRVLTLPIHVSGGGGVVMDLQPVRSRIKYPLNGTAATSHQNTVYRCSHLLETAATATMLTLTPSRFVVIDFVPAVFAVFETT